MLLSTSGGECYGDSLATPSNINSCVHSGTIAAENTYSGIATNTVWYNYTAATAGTITVSSLTDPVENINTATESVCPKGWTLPGKAQADILASGGGTVYISAFDPVMGGHIVNGAIGYQDSFGPWWLSGAYNANRRYRLQWNGTNLISDDGLRGRGYYIRCVSEEKDVSDLTYMQDMTPSVAANTAERTAFPTILQELCVIVNVLRA